MTLKPKVEDLYQEFEVKGKWIWLPKNNEVSDKDREDAYSFLSLTPERYYHPPKKYGRIRISYRER